MKIIKNHRKISESEKGAIVAVGNFDGIHNGHKALINNIIALSKIKDKKNTFLLESIEGGENWAQYSIVGIDCRNTIKISGKNIEIKIDEDLNLFESEDPLNELNKIINE